MLHGYGGARSAQLHSLFANHGFGVISWDARAHGESGGKLCSFGFFEKLDVMAAIQFAGDIERINHIGAFGESMGGATLIMAAADYPQIEALIVDSPYANIADMLDIVVPYPVLRPFIQFFIEAQSGLKIDDLRPELAIGKISPRPIFIIQGDSDQTVPPQSATILYKAAGDPKQLWIEPGIGHVGTFVAYPQEYESRVIAFFSEFLLNESSGMAHEK